MHVMLFDVPEIGKACGMKRFGRLRAVVVVALAAILSVTIIVAPATPSAAVEAASLSQLKARGIYFLRTGDADDVRATGIRGQ